MAPEEVVAGVVTVIMCLELVEEEGFVNRVTVEVQVEKLCAKLSISGRKGH